MTMNTSIRNLFAGAALAVTAICAGKAQAIPFTNGSLAIGAGTTTTTAVNTTTAFAVVPPTVSLGTGTGDFTGFSATFAATTFDLNDLSTFNFVDAVLGSFTATSIV